MRGTLNLEHTSSTKASRLNMFGAYALTTTHRGVFISTHLGKLSLSYVTDLENGAIKKNERIKKTISRLPGRILKLNLFQSFPFSSFPHAEHSG